MNKSTQNLIFMCSGILLVASAAFHIFEQQQAVAKIAIAPYLFSVAAAGFVVIRILNPIKSDDFRIRRMQGMQAIGALLLIASAYFMFTGNNFWALTLIIASVIELVVSFRMPKDE